MEIPVEVEKNEFPEAVEADTSSHEISPTEEQPPLTTTQSHISANTGTGRSLDGGAKPKAAIIMPALCMAVFLGALDMSIVSTALPSIAGEFKITQADYNWIGSAYTLGSAATTPPWGKISDIFGRKPVLLAANVVFLVGSLLCGVAVDIQMLIAGRAIQGAGAGGLIALVNICIADLFSQRNRGLYYGFIGGVWAFAGAIGPIIGGAFAQYVTWRWCFYINLPLDGVTLLILYFFLDIPTPATPVLAGLAAIDWLGIVTCVGGIVLFLIGLQYGGVSYPWSSALVICMIVFGALLVFAFFLIEWKIAKYPLFPVRLFTPRSNAFAFAVRFCHGFIFISASYYLPLYFQAVLDATPFEAGLQLLAYILSTSIPGFLVGFTIRKTGNFKIPISLGMFVMTIGFGLFIDLPSFPNYARIIPAQIIAGLGTGPNFQAPLIALQAHSAASDIATIGGGFAFVGQCGSSISLVVAGAILQNRLQLYTSTLSATLDQSQIAQIVGGNAASSVQVIQSLPEPARSVVHTVFTESMQTIWIFYTVLAFCGFILSLFIQHKALETKHTIQKQGLEMEERNRLERLARKAQNRNDMSEGV